MFSLLQVRIGTRLAAAFGALILLLVALCAYSAFNTRQLAADLEATANSDLVRMNLAYGLGENVAIVARASREMLLLDAAGPLKKQRALVTQSLAESDPDDARQALLIELRPVQASYEKSLQALSDWVMARAAERAQADRRMAEAHVWTMVLFGIVGVALAGTAGALIAVASGRQEAGIGSINRSVNDLDQSTQQNAALVEELAATMQSLKTHASRLVSAVGFFRVSAGAHA